MSTFSSANITDGNLVLKECTHRIKIKYSMHPYSIRLHNLCNWLMSLMCVCIAEMHVHLYNNIVLTGGSCQFPGFKDRLYVLL